MRLQKKIVSKIILPLIALILGAFVSSQPQLLPNVPQITPPQQVKGMYSQTARVVQVIDGDTFKLDTGEKVRIIGVDTPEIHHPTKPVQCFGNEAMLKTKELIEGKTVRLEKDVSETDRYGRLLRFVYLDDSSHLFLNAYLVKEGYAHVSTFPPDVSKADLFRQLQDEARKNNKGLWQKCL